MLGVWVAVSRVGGFRCRLGGPVVIPVTNNLRKAAVSLTASLLPVRAASAVPEGIGLRKHYWTNVQGEGVPGTHCAWTRPARLSA